MNINIKKDSKLFKLLFVFLSITFFFSGCLKIVPVTGVKIDGGDKYLNIEETLQLTATIEPSDATNKAVIWESSDNSKVTIDEKGLVTTIAKTGAEITVITKDGKYEDTIAVYVGIANTNSNSAIDPGATCVRAIPVTRVTPVIPAISVTLVNQTLVTRVANAILANRNRVNLAIHATQIHVILATPVSQIPAIPVEIVITPVNLNPIPAMSAINKYTYK